MKCIFYVLVLCYVCYRSVCGAKVDTSSISVDQIDYGDVEYLEVGSRKLITCRLSNRNRMLNKLEWLDPNGNVISRTPGRVFAKENVVTNTKGVRSGLVLNLNYLGVNDTGVYTCRYGKQMKEVPVCVIQATEFGDTETNVSVQSGRSITLHCKVIGKPEPNLQWYRHDEEIIDDEKYKVNKIFNVEGHESLLTVFSAGPEDDGVYTCTAVQKNPALENCTNTEILNVTLQVSQMPWFENNSTVNIYANKNQDVELKCTAKGWPIPSYRWFEDLGSDTLHEFDQNKIILSEDKREATIHVTAGSETFGQTYKCKATNPFGETDQYFKLLETTKPEKPDDIELSFATDSEIVFNVTWKDDIVFPVDSFAIQYIESSSVRTKKPREHDWNKASVTQMDVDRDEGSDEPGILVKLESLDSETEYWVRVKAVNDVGESPWSDPTQASTEPTNNIDIEKATIIDDEDDDDDSSAFYGIFFAGSIAIIVAVCMFIMRMV